MERRHAIKGVDFGGAVFGSQVISCHQVPVLASQVDRRAAVVHLHVGGPESSNVRCYVRCTGVLILHVCGHQNPVSYL